MLTGSSSRASIAALREKLKSTECDYETAQQIFAVAGLLIRTPQLRVVLGDPAQEAEVKIRLAHEFFAKAVSSKTLALIDAAVSLRWSLPMDLFHAFEELGLRILALCSPSAGKTEQELFDIYAVLEQNSELEMRLSSRLVRVEEKKRLIRELFGGRVCANTLLLLEHFFEHPQGRRAPDMVISAAQIVADQAGAKVAHVTVAKPLNETSRQKLLASLQERLQQPVLINEIVDPNVRGGVKVQVGFKVIDATVSARMASLEHLLVG